MAARGASKLRNILFGSPLPRRFHRAPPGGQHPHSTLNTPQRISKILQEDSQRSSKNPEPRNVEESERNARQIREKRRANPREMPGKSERKDGRIPERERPGDRRPSSFSYRMSRLEKIESNLIICLLSDPIYKKRNFIEKIQGYTTGCRCLGSKSIDEWNRPLNSGGLCVGNARVCLARRHGDAFQRICGKRGKVSLQTPPDSQTKEGRV